MERAETLFERLLKNSVATTDMIRKLFRMNVVTDPLLR